MNIDPLFLIMGVALAFSAGAAFGGWWVQRPIKGPLERERDWPEPKPRELTEREIELAKGMANSTPFLGYPERKDER